jgi:RES domain-containing protein
MSIVQEKELRLRPALQHLSTEQLGDWWRDSQVSAVLQVPSLVIAGEHNFLLSPAHSEFARVQVEPPAIFHFDERLFAGS